MKIRIKGNSIRLRLSQSEVNKIKSESSISDVIQFPERKLIYTLSKSDIDSVCAEFNETQILVKAPVALINTWVGSGQVGFEANQDLKEGESLYILVEKDFKCSIDRNEDESDLFNPPI
ncbi:MAG: hypothetical protein AAF731_02345 [Bacteroidota bacterium]